MGADDRSEVVITVSRDVKARWVAESRARGQKLTDWLIERIDDQDGQQALPSTMSSPYVSPTPDEIRRARETSGLSQSQAAATVLVVLRTWQRWEYGERQMPPGLWELFQLKTGTSASATGDR
jgi:DNA-binding transcriptional regulator YiaG